VGTLGFYFVGMVFGVGARRGIVAIGFTIALSYSNIQKIDVFFVSAFLNVNMGMVICV
jgi:hypothetical protein